MVDDGWGEMSWGTKRVRLTHHKKNFYRHPHINRYTDTHTQAGKHEQRLLTDDHSISNQDTQSHELMPSKSISAGLTLSLMCKHMS